MFNPRRDALREATLNERCLNAIAGKDIVMVRGMIYGIETISSIQTVTGNVSSTSLREKNIEVNMTLMAAIKSQILNPSQFSG